VRAGHVVAAALLPVVLTAMVIAFNDAAVGASTGGREVIGRSVRGRPILAYRIGDPRGRPVLVVGCTDGDEPAGTAIVAALRRLPPPAGIDLWLVPTINPDGLASDTTGNAHGVDLNRNFPYRWVHLGGSGYFNSGPRPLSEPESRALHRFLLRVKPRLAVWFHQPLALVDDSQGSRRLERVFARRVGLPLRSLTDYPGSITNWENHHFPRSTAFVTELPRGRLTRTRATRYARAILAVARLQAQRARNGRAPTLR
jgi:murein peptide amidase A